MGLHIPSLESLELMNASVGWLSNKGAERYLIEAQSSTGFIAWRTASGQPLVSRSTIVSIRPTKFLLFWSCAAFDNTTPAGEINFLDCHGNSLTHLDVRSLTALEYLDASFNRLSKVSLDGLTHLEALDVESNELTSLDVKGLRSLRFLNCGSNRITRLDVSALKRLEVLEYAGNPIAKLNTRGCASLATAR